MQLQYARLARGVAGVHSPANPQMKGHPPYRPMQPAQLSRINRAGWSWRHLTVQRCPCMAFLSMHLVLGPGHRCEPSTPSICSAVQKLRVACKAHLPISMNYCSLATVATS